MGEVYLAEDTSLKRKVALKFLPEYLQSDEVAQKRFLREAQSAAALDHPYICHIHEVGEAEGKSFIAMEYVEGHTLKDRLDQGRVPLEDALLIGSEVAEALEKAHKAGVVHRDLKPSNMMITTEGHAKVMDFGLAKRLTGEDATEQEITAALTREGTTLGTPAYMSPEQLQARRVDNRSDIFSFGIVLYELLTGVHPFKRETTAGTTASILKDEPGDLLQHEEGVAPLLEHMVKKMLAKDPAERYQSIHEVNTNLAQVVREPGKAFPSPPSTRRWRPAAVSLLLIAVAAGALWLLYRLLVPFPETIDSLAILRFATQGDHPRLEILARGIPDNLISKLSPLFEVKGRISSFKFSPDSDVHELGEALNVGAVVAGTLTVADDFFSISVELVDTKDGHQLWSEQFTHWNLEDLITKQDVFAAELAEVLQLQLTQNEAAQLERRYTNDIEAFSAYQEGRRVYKTMDRQLDALDHFKAAIAADPNYAPAYAGISTVYGQLAMWGALPISQALPAIEEFSAKALELDPTLAEAYCAIGQQKVLGWDWQGAEKAFRRAIELNPNLPDGYRSLAMYFLLPTGKLDEAIMQLEKALELDPLAPWINLNLGMVYLNGRSNDEAVGYFRRVCLIAPHS